VQLRYGRDLLFIRDCGGLKFYSSFSFFKI
jgi:hypothetical protein